ncbi:MAG: hypothetical protein ABI399_04380 [Bauldia sp.]
MRASGIGLRAATGVRAFVVVMLAGVAAPAAAGPIADQAAEAETLMSAGNAEEALSLFDKAAGAFWVSSPLQLRKALFADDIAGFGQYTPRADATFKPGSRATVYLEPFGYAFVEDGDMFRIALAADLQIRTPGGLILAKADDFGGLEWSGREKSREVHAQVGVDLPDLKPGSYELVLTLRDKSSPKTTTTTLPFSVAAP